MTKQPCLRVLIIFILGIISGRYLYLPVNFVFPLLIVLFLISLLFFAIQKEIICNIFLSLTILTSGFILTLNSIQSPESKNLEKFIGSRIEIVGKVTDEPRIYSNWTENIISIKTVNNNETKGLIRLRIYGGRIFSYNDIIKCNIVLERPPFYFLSEGINAVSHAGGSKVDKIGEDEGNIKSAGLAFKKYIQNQYFYYLPRMEAVLASGIVLGGDQNIPEGVQQIFRDTGTVHILSVSGMNVSLVGVICFILLVHIFRIPKKIAVVPAIFMVWFYALATGLNSPVVRSGITLTIVFLGYILEREGDVLNGLAIAALIILLLSPLALFSISFQLSFACVLSMILIYPALGKFHKKADQINLLVPDNYMERYSNDIKKLFLLSLAIQIGVWPIGAFYFQQVSLVSVIANIFVVPLVGIILYLGVTMVIFSKISILAKILANASWFLLIILERIVFFFAKLPYSNFSIQSLSLFFVLCYYAVIILMLSSQSCLKTKKAKD